MLATAASLKIAAFSAGSAAAGLLTGAATARELLLGIAAGQLLSVAALWPARRRDQDQEPSERDQVAPEARRCSS